MMFVIVEDNSIKLKHSKTGYMVYIGYNWHVNVSQNIFMLQILCFRKYLQYTDIHDVEKNNVQGQTRTFCQIPLQKKPQ